RAAGDGCERPGHRRVEAELGGPHRCVDDAVEGHELVNEDRSHVCLPRSSQWSFGWSSYAVTTLGTFDTARAERGGRDPRRHDRIRRERARHPPDPSIAVTKFTEIGTRGGFGVTVLPTGALLLRGAAGRAVNTTVRGD